MTATEVLPSSIDQFQRCAERGQKLADLRDMPENKRGDTYDADMRSTVRELSVENAIYDLALKAEERAFNEQVWEHTTKNPPRPEARGPQAAFAAGGEQFLSAGEQFVRALGSEQGDSLEVRNMVSDSDAIEVRNLLTTSTTGTPAAGLFAPVGSPQLYVPPRRRRLFARDLLNVVQTNLNSIPYIRELNAATNELGATAVAEASAKPEVTSEFERDDAPIRKLAAWLQVTEEELEDAPIIRGYIDGRLGYMLMVREEVQIIGVTPGGNSAPNIKGLLDYSGVQTATGEFYDMVAAAIGKIENVDGDADGVVANPLDYWAAVSDRHATFYDGGALLAGSGSSPFGTPQLTAWGLPVVRSRSLASGTSLVGSWGMGATLFERMGTTIKTTDSHASLFVSNTWIILAEERVGLAVHRADWFVKGTVTAPS
jgi:HK97 family phage major capsid protein